MAGAFADRPRHRVTVGRTPPVSMSQMRHRLGGEYLRLGKIKHIFLAVSPLGCWA
jgi:hypothetical protein